MNREENLIPLNVRPKDVQRKIQKMGIEASRKIRAKRLENRKTIQQILKDVLLSKITSPELKETIDEIDIYKGDKDKNNLLALVISVFYTGVKKGDSKVLKDLIELAGEKTAEKIEVTPRDSIILEIREYLALKHNS